VTTIDVEVKFPIIQITNLNSKSAHLVSLAPRDDVGSISEFISGNNLMGDSSRHMP